MQIGIFWVFTKIVVFTIAYILGHYNFSFGWLLPLFFASIQDHFYCKRAVKKAITHKALQLDEREAVLSRLDEIPAWVLFPDFERTEWINKIINLLWPGINSMFLSSLKEFEPVLQQNNILRTFTFKKVSLGKISPKITGIKVYDQTKLYVDELIVDITICYFGDLELSFSLNGIEGGIKDIELEGLIRIALRPLIFQMPFASSLEIYFLKHPRTDFEFTMGLASLDMFATGELIRSILKDQISLFMVYPNKLKIKLDKNISLPDFVMPKIDGVVRVHIYGIDNVEGNEIFLSIDLGQDFVKTPTMNIQMDNVKSVKFKFSRDLIAFANGDEEVHLTLNKRDDDLKTVKVGTVSIKLQEIKENKCITKDFKLPSLEVISSKICWLPLSDDGDDLYLLQVYIDSGRKIHPKFTPFVELSVDEQVRRSSIGKSEDEIAVWEKNFHFYIPNPKTDKLIIKLIDQVSLQNLGSYTYYLKDLSIRKNKQHELQAFPMNSSNNYEIVMALKLNPLKISEYKTSA